MFSQLPSYPTNSQDTCVPLGSHFPESPCAASSLPYQVQASCHWLQGVLKCTLAFPLLLLLGAVSPVMPRFVFFSHFTSSVLLLTLSLQDLFHSSCRLCLKTLWMSKQMSSQLVTATVQRQLKKPARIYPENSDALGL